MKKRITTGTGEATIGMDLGDKFHAVHELDAEGNTVFHGRISATRQALERTFKDREPVTVAMECGTHSPWTSRLLEEWGHRVLVANPRKLRAIYENPVKDDDRDAEMLARLARVDPELLYPIRHRGRRAQAHRAILKSRDALVKTRTILINQARGIVKGVGERLPRCSAPSFAKKAKDYVPEDLRDALGPVLKTIEELTEKIKHMEKKLTKIRNDEYPEARYLESANGVGPLTAMAFVLTLEDPGRFARSRDVPVYLGLLPRRDQSGETDKQLPITKAGDRYLRRLLVSCAQYILGPFGTDSALRRWGLAMCARGGKNAKKRAVVAVARKLAVILHCLWKRKEYFEPFHESSKGSRQAA